MCTAKDKMINLVREIYERKRGKVHPEGATELEIQQELSRRGVHYTTELFQQMCTELKRHPRITTYRTLNHTAYAYNTETPEKRIPAQEGGPGAKITRKYAILSEPAVAQSEEKLSRRTSPVCGVPGKGGDNTSDDSGSHHANQYWWSEI